MVSHLRSKYPHICQITPNEEHLKSKKLELFILLPTNLRKFNSFEIKVIFPSSCVPWINISHGLLDVSWCVTLPSPRRRVLVWVPPKIGPEKKIKGLIVYLGGDPGNTNRRWGREGKKGREPTWSALSGRAPLSATRIQPSWGTLGVLWNMPQFSKWGTTE